MVYCVTAINESLATVITRELIILITSSTDQLYFYVAMFVVSICLEFLCMSYTLRDCSLFMPKGGLVFRVGFPI